MIAHVAALRLWAICLIASYAFVLVVRPDLAARSAQPTAVPAIDAQVMSDGSVKINNEQFSDPAKLKAKIAEIKRARPSIEIHLRAQKDTPFRTIGAAMLLLQKAGVIGKVGFITEIPAYKVSDAESAIQIVRMACRRDTSKPGKDWHAQLVDGSWHVWEGPNTSEPICGFFGAYVDARTGNATECQVSLCDVRRKQK